MDIDALKQAAIDAYMRTEGYSVKDDHYFDYGLGFSAYVGRDGHGTATYPSMSPYAPPTTTDLDYSGHFSTIRSNIDSALEEWQDDKMPTAAQCDAKAVEATAAVTALNVGNSTALGGALGGYLKTVSDNAPLFRGETADAFNNSFVNQLPAVISNHGCLASLVVEAWGASKEIWTKAREDRDTHVETCTTAFKNYAESGGPNEVKFVLALTGAAIAGASAIATGGIALPFTLATVGVTSLSAINDYAAELEVERNGANFEELMDAFVEGLGDIDEGITKQEQLIADGLENAWTTFEANRPLFDLTPRATDDGDGNWNDETSIFDVQDAAGISFVVPAQEVVDSLSSGMVNLAHGIGDAAPKVVAGDDTANVLSDRTVGLQYSGIAIYMYILSDNNASSLRNLQWDVREGNAMYQAVIRDFQDNDTASQTHMDTIRERLSVGSGEDPWA
ncbi:hypothetical protein ABFT23_02785 [Nocardioides sp. C4-1]|uniref:hypothetical protein n=1 Tax=Nocardioides sp. C4-1 TaxID=3151851 RepID=UPI003264A91E